MTCPIPIFPNSSITFSVVNDFAKTKFVRAYMWYQSKNTWNTCTSNSHLQSNPGLGLSVPQTTFQYSWWCLKFLLSTVDITDSKCKGYWERSCDPQGRRGEKDEKEEESWKMYRDTASSRSGKQQPRGLHPLCAQELKEPARATLAQLVPDSLLVKIYFHLLAGAWNSSNME